jgi:DnaK suppressor protein
MKVAPGELDGVREILEKQQAELIHGLRKRDGITIERSADQMDEIQYASERDLAMRNVDRESTLLNRVKAVLRRIHDGSFGSCFECESAIGPKRLAAVPWARCCIQCQETADRKGRAPEDVSETLVNAAQSDRRNAVRHPKHCVSQRLLAAQMRHCHVYIRLAYGGGCAASPKLMFRGAGQ